MVTFDGAIHVHAAFDASVALDEGGAVDNLEFVAIFDDLDMVVRRHGDNRKYGARRLPALGAAASVVMGDIALDGDLDGIVGAFAGQCAAGKIGATRLYAVID
jgi:hypothetical protein